MNKTELAKQLNKKYQEINTQKDYKGNRTLLEWEHVPATDRFVWERMAEWVLESVYPLYREEKIKCDECDNGKTITFFKCNSVNCIYCLGTGYITNYKVI